MAENVEAIKLSGPYRKLYPAFWRDEKVNQLNAFEKLMAAYLLTGPQTNRIGLYRLSEFDVQVDLALSRPQVGRLLVSVTKKLGWERDLSTRILFIQSWWEWNEPEGPNQFKACLKDLAGLPRCPITLKFLNNDAFLTNAAFREMLRNVLETFLKGSPIQEQEPNQTKQGTKQRTKPEGVDALFEKFWQAYPRKEAKLKALESFGRLVPTEALLQSIIGDLERRKGSHDWKKSDGQYIPHPTTYLNQRRWEDQSAGDGNKANAEHSGGTRSIPEKARGDAGEYADAIRARMQPVPKP